MTNRELVCAALADHAATLARLSHEKRRKRPEEAEDYLIEAKRCLSLAVDIQKGFDPFAHDDQELRTGETAQQKTTQE